MQRRYRFAHFELLVTERQLLMDGRAVALGARAFDLLLALVESRDRTVGKDELLDVVWPGLVVEANNLQVQVSGLRKVLGQRAIATIPGRGYRFALEATDCALAPQPAPAPSSAGNARPQPGNLPEVLPELIGRASDVASLLAAMGAHRMVSVVGAAGIGKTRLAQAAAHALRREFADGVWMVELAPVVDPAFLATAVAQALGVTLAGKRSAQDEVIDALRHRAVLLVLDNCEHLVDAASAFAHAVRLHVPEAHLLITSQELLRIADEHLFHVTPLSLPVTLDLMAARVSGAVALLVNRVQTLQASFALTAQNCADVVEICRRLDGLPLAIELAAARVPLLGIAGVRERLDERFRMLTGGMRTALRRHQTLREAIEWSHGLLDAEERAVFRRAGVFAGSFSMSAAQEVLGDAQIDAWEVLDHLGALVDKSLVMAEAAEPPRYRLLESARAYALEELRDAGEADATRERHAQAVFAIFEAGLHQHWAQPREALVEANLPDSDNLRAALDWAAVTRPSLHIALAGASAWMWNGTGQRAEALRICGRAMTRINERTPPAAEARLLSEWCVLSCSPPHPAERAAAERAVALFRSLGDRRSAYLALERLHIIAHRRSDAATCERAAQDMAELYDPAWPAASRWHMLMARAICLWMRHQTEESRVAFEGCLQLARTVREARHVHVSLLWLIDVAAETGHTEQALILCRDLVAMIRADRFSSRLAMALCTLSSALAGAGELDEALAAGRESIPMHAQQGTPLWIWLLPFARIAIQQGRVSDAGLAFGRAEAKYAGSSKHQSERDAMRALLTQSVASAELRSLLADGAELSDEEAAHIALAARSVA